jgi:hypothetical protein
LQHQENIPAVHKKDGKSFGSKEQAVMEVCKHKISGKIFIFLKEAGFDKAVFVTPQSKIKTLNIDQFDEIEDENRDDLLSQGRITELQINRFEQYKKDRTENEVDNLIYAFNQLSSYGKIQFFKELPISQLEKEKLIKLIKKGVI